MGSAPVILLALKGEEDIAPLSRSVSQTYLLASHNSAYVQKTRGYASKYISSNSFYCYIYSYLHPEYIPESLPADALPAVAAVMPFKPLSGLFLYIIQVLLGGIRLSAPVTA